MMKNYFISLFISYRTYSTDPMKLAQMAIGQVKKFFYGSENTYNNRDVIYEKMMAEGKNPKMQRYVAKVIYVRDKARTKIVKHNERIRHLEDKIDGGVFKNNRV